MILVELTSDEDFADSMYSISKKKLVGFEIEEIDPGSVPFVRAKNHPVQRDPR